MIEWYESRYSTEENIPKIIGSRIKYGEVLVDVGCGIRPQRFFTPLVHVCIEPYDQYATLLSESRNKGYPLVILNCTWDRALPLMATKSVDTIVILDMIEHIPKEEGMKLLEESERVARSQIIVFTPLGEYIQDFHERDRWGMDGGEWQTHKCGWNPEDFDDTWDLICVKDWFRNDRWHKQECGAIWAFKNLDFDGGVKGVIDIRSVEPIEGYKL